MQTLGFSPALSCSETTEFSKTMMNVEQTRVRSTGKRTAGEFLTAANESPSPEWSTASAPLCQRDAAQVQREFIDLANAENLFALVRGNANLCARRQIEVHCVAIANTISCIVVHSSSDAASAKFFESVLPKARAFAAASAAERSALLDETCRCFVRLGSQLALEMHRLVTRLTTEPVTSSACVLLTNRQAIEVYRLVIAETQALRALIDRQLQIKKAADVHVEMTRSVKRRLFSVALQQCTAATPAKVAGGDPQCCVCSQDYSGTVQRLTLACCRHKQSICKDCFVAATYENSNEGIKTFAHCPFCRTAFQLYPSATTDKPAD